MSLRRLAPSLLDLCRGELADAVVERLVKLIATPDNSAAATDAARLLAGQRELGHAPVDRLSRLASDGQ
jgi:hypothetical protein